MEQKSFLFSSESVSEGHPDKVCDQIADAVLDSYIRQDPTSRVACECLAKSGMIVVAGEMTSRGYVNYDQVVRETLREIGYTSVECGCDANSVAVMTNITQQSPDIAQGVNENEGAFVEQGAGDQGLMFGYACDETPEYMPLAIALAHRLMKKMADIRHSGQADFLRPDSKSQVTVRYENGQPKTVDTVVISTQHADSVDMHELKDWVTKNIIKQVIPDNFLSRDTRIFVNPTGRFVLGGPQADAGVTGRKIIVDSYGGYGRHGGGAFSGKDPSKVDRSAAYASRYVAKNVVAAGLASKCEIQVAYAIGIAEPVSVLVDTFGTNKVSEDKIATVVKEVFSFAPKQIIKQLGLLKPIYKVTAAYGHFGRTPGNDGSFSWERLDLVDQLKKFA